MALVNGSLLDPTTGQVALRVSHVRVNAFLTERRAADDALRRRLLDERRHRPARSMVPRGRGKVQLE
jgi:hypothetical protein